MRATEPITKNSVLDAPPAPVFLVAARRSGTTLLRVMMSAHPDILFYNGWEKAADALATLPAEAARKCELNGLEPFSANDLAEFSATVSARIREALAREGRTLFGATCHIGFLELQKAWPDARYIHLIRDPRDVAISHLSLGWSGHPYLAAKAWKNAERDWESLCATTHPDRCFDLRYEDLVAAPERELERLCGFLGLPYTDAMFHYTKTTSYSYPKKELAGRWRGKLSDRDLMLIEAPVRDLMVSRGYAPAGAARDFGAGTRKLFTAQDWLIRKGKRIRSRGLGEVLHGKIVRMIGTKAMRDRHAAAAQARHEEAIRALEKRY